MAESPEQRPSRRAKRAASRSPRAWIVLLDRSPWFEVRIGDLQRQLSGVRAHFGSCAAGCRPSRSATSAGHYARRRAGGSCADRQWFCPSQRTAQYACARSGWLDRPASPACADPARRCGGPRCRRCAAGYAWLSGRSRTAEACGGKVRVIASIEDPAVIGRILGQLAARAAPVGSRPPARGPPPGEFGFH